MAAHFEPAEVTAGNRQVVGRDSTRGWPLLRVWTALRPNSSVAWTMTGWAHQIDGQPDLAKTLLRRALDLAPENDDTALILGNLPSA
jgi:hypothetical protein